MMNGFLYSIDDIVPFLCLSIQTPLHYKLFLLLLPLPKSMIPELDIHIC